MMCEEEQRCREPVWGTLSSTVSLGREKSWTLHRAMSGWKCMHSVFIPRLQDAGPGCHCVLSRSAAESPVWCKALWHLPSSLLPPQPCTRPPLDVGLPHTPRSHPRLPAGVPLLGCPPVSPPHSVRRDGIKDTAQVSPSLGNSPAPPAEVHTHSLTHSLQWRDLLTPLPPCSTMNFLKAVCLSISSTGRVPDTQEVVNKTRDGLDWNTVPGTERGRNSVGRVRRPQLQLQLCWFLLQEPPARVLDCLT